MFRDKIWTDIGDIGKQWRLIEFDESKPPTWEAYWKGQRDYWGADKQDKKRLELYFGKQNTEEKLLQKSLKKYHDFVKYLRKWNGLCKVNEVVQVIKLEENVIALSKEWTGKVRDQKDLEIWLKREYKFGLIPMEYYCEIYSFGTIAKYALHPQEHGRVSHRKGKSPNKNEPVEIINQKFLKIGDAKFEVL